MKAVNLRITLLLIAIQGLAVVGLLLSNPSEPDNAKLLGYSYSRLLLVFIVFTASTISLAAALSKKLPLAASAINNWITHKDRYPNILILIVTALTILAGAFLFTWLFIPPLLRSVIAWVFLVIFQSGIHLLFSYKLPARPAWWDKAALPKIADLSPQQRKVFTVLAIVGTAYFILFIPPNLNGAETPHDFFLYGGDEKIMYPILTRMFEPGEDFSGSLYNVFIYEDYHYGFPFYLLSALTLLPVRLGFGSSFAQQTQLNLLLLRQFISVLPLILAVLVLVFLFTRFRKTWISLLLFTFILITPGAVGYNIRFWHPDSLALLMAVLTLFFLDRDQNRLGPNFYYAAITCGLASSIRFIGFFFFLAIACYLIIVLVKRQAHFRELIIKGVVFVSIMFSAFLLTSPYLFDTGARQRFINIMAEKTEEMKTGYNEPDPEGVYSIGFPAWLPFMEKGYGSRVFLTLALASLILGSIYGKESKINLLTLAWFIPYTGYLSLFLAVKSLQYLLPVLIPFISGIINPLVIAGEMHSQKSIYSRIMQGVVLGAIILQAAAFLPIVIRLWMD